MVLWRWVHEASVESKQAFPGRGQMKPDDAEVARLKRELAKTKAEREILKNHRLLREGPDVRFAAIAKLRQIAADLAAALVRQLPTNEGTDRSAMRCPAMKRG